MKQFQNIKRIQNVKRFQGLILALVMTLFAGNLFRPLIVSADVIYEPDNSFYRRHSMECTYLNRSCIAGEDTLLWNSPNSYFSRETVAEGQIFSVSYVYTDENGLEWGLADSFGKWVLMADVFLPYSSREFIRDHKDEIYEGEPYILEEGTDYVRWSYPGSGSSDEETSSLMGDITFTTFYEDPAGRLWGYREYMFGSRHVWLCLSDLTSTQIPKLADYVPAPGQEADPALITEAKENGQVNIWFLVIPVVAVAVVSGLLIWRFWIHRRRKL
ncbi:hypothetical protein B5F07_11900 [Lachnoclostridium sp. An169]|uniref:hypothetical protein n=1 Tax=Lachnoclostridium sp. An169 TaxID=1965569 RepID=UPI000B36A83A|nr:hypothetical protein [Lachnoclostridium sp. An169]OUP83114.1 hypothetical protein B5F07_11900 [Lachnoclostridium sp. An169]